MPRLATSTPDLDLAERAWWQRYGGVEEAFCWVQPPAVQRLLRGRYIDEIVGLVDVGTRVLELGCGTGWLSLLLAERGVDVVGLDFSPEQIDRARGAASSAGVDGVHFEVGSAASLAERGERFGLVVVHALLHHLATTEIEALVADVAELLDPGGRLVLFEPVSDPAGRLTPTLAERALRRMEHLPLVLSNHHLRRIRPDERSARAEVGGRGAGTPPFGPSPKELAFVPGEVPGLLDGRFNVVRQRREAALTYRVAEQLLLAELSQPRLWRGVRPMLLRVARFLDTRSLRAEVAPRDLWVFTLFECRVADATGVG